MFKDQVRERDEGGFDAQGQKNEKDPEARKGLFTHQAETGSKDCHHKNKGAEGRGAEESEGMREIVIQGLADRKDEKSEVGSDNIQLGDEIHAVRNVFCGSGQKSYLSVVMKKILMSQKIKFWEDEGGKDERKEAFYKVRDRFFVLIEEQNFTKA